MNEEQRKEFQKLMYEQCLELGLVFTELDNGRNYEQTQDSVNELIITLLQHYDINQKTPC